MSNDSKAPIEYGPDPDDEVDDGIEVSVIQKAFVPFYALLFVMFLAVASIPVIYIYTIIWMNVDARSQIDDNTQRR